MIVTETIESWRQDWYKQQIRYGLLTETIKTGKST